MVVTRTHFTFRIDTWTPDGESIVEHVAGVEDYQVTLATYRAAVNAGSARPLPCGRGRHSSRCSAAIPPGVLALADEVIERACQGHC
jgi:hypothetical protein